MSNFIHTTYILDNNLNDLDVGEWKEIIKKQIIANEGRNVIADVTSVARSGMSRRIKFAVSINNELQPLTWWIAVTLGGKHDACKGLLVRGCGMDMIYETLRRFYFKAFEIDSLEAAKLANQYRSF